MMKIKHILPIAFMFCAGTTLMAQGSERPAGPEEMAKAQVADLTASLDLNEEQQQHAYKLIMAQEEQLGDMRAQQAKINEKIDAVSSITMEEIGGMLNEEQQSRMAEMNKEKSGKSCCAGKAGASKSCAGSKKAAQ